MKQSQLWTLPGSPNFKDSHREFWKQVLRKSGTATNDLVKNHQVANEVVAHLIYDEEGIRFSNGYYRENGLICKAFFEVLQMRVAQNSRRKKRKWEWVTIATPHGFVKAMRIVE